MGARPSSATTRRSSALRASAIVAASATRPQQRQDGRCEEAEDQSAVDPRDRAPVDPRERGFDAPQGPGQPDEERDRERDELGRRDLVGHEKGRVAAEQIEQRLPQGEGGQREQLCGGFDRTGHGRRAAPAPGIARGCGVVSQGVPS